MRILIAPDSFKEALPAPQVARAVAAGLVRGFPGVETVLLPLADGGEGTIDVLAEARSGRIYRTVVTAANGERKTAKILFMGEEAVVEAAEAVGLGSLPEPRSPWEYTGLGVGQMVAAALRRGARVIHLGLGGTGTLDGGLGLLRALGVTAVDEAGKEVPPTLRGIERARRLVRGQVPAGLRLVGLTDVSAPLLGAGGAARLYGPQKGLRPEELGRAEAALQHWNDLLSRAAGRNLAELPGSGAAGGMGAAVLFMGGRLLPGIGRIMELVGFRSAVAAADLVVTGEGHLDRQTLQGKVVDGVVRVCREQSRPVIALVGGIAAGFRPLYRRGLLAAFTIGDGIARWPEAGGRTAADLRRTAESIGRLLASPALSRWAFPYRREVQPEQ